MKLGKFLAFLVLLPVPGCARSSAPEPYAPSNTPFSNNDSSGRAYASGPSGEAELPAPAPLPSTARGGSYDGAPAAAPRASRPGSGSAYQPPAEKKAEE